MSQYRKVISAVIPAALKRGYCLRSSPPKDQFDQEKRVVFCNGKKVRAVDVEILLREVGLRLSDYSGVRVHGILASDQLLDALPLDTNSQRLV